MRPGRFDALVYYSDHGVPGLKTRRGYLMPVDSDPNLAETLGFSLDVLYENLKRLSVRSVTVVFDTCFSGISRGGALLTG